MSRGRSDNSQVASSVPFDNEDTDFEAEDAREAIIEARNTIDGKIYNLVFTEAGLAINEWLGHVEQSNTSDESPAVIPFDSKLIALTFTNNRDDVDTDIEIYRSAAGSGNSSSLIYNWQLRNIRVAHISDFPSTILFNQGDKLGIYLEDNGGNPSDVIVTAYFQIDKPDVGSGSENYSGDL